jgi:adenine C2-methylase RlmN of 23S rRNA A2503 and tRNA A37
MGFSRQLSSTEIFEQAQKFSAELRKENQRLSNIVMMGMVFSIY